MRPWAFDVTPVAVEAVLGEELMGERHHIVHRWRTAGEPRVFARQPRED